MSETPSINTWIVLRELGFQPVDEISFGDFPTLYFDFGNFSMSASWIMNRWFAKVVQFNGVLRTERTLTEVRFEMPLRIESLEICAAWIIYHLDQAASHGMFVPAREVSWLAEGREYKHLLPWERERKAYNARPRCIVQREWMKLAIKDLSETLSGVADDEPVVFDFDGRVLTIKCAGKTVLVAAEGSAWPSMFQLLKGEMRRLPKRLMNPSVGVSVWQSGLLIGNYRYKVFAEVPKDKELKTP